MPKLLKHTPGLLSGRDPKNCQLVPLRHDFWLPVLYKRDPYNTCCQSEAGTPLLSRGESKKKAKLQARRIIESSHDDITSSRKITNTKPRAVK